MLIENLDKLRGWIHYQKTEMTVNTTLKNHEVHQPVATYLKKRRRIKHPRCVDRNQPGDERKRILIRRFRAKAFTSRTGSQFLNNMKRGDGGLLWQILYNR